MARPRKVPAVLVEATVRENAKLAALASDSARLGYFYVCLGAAKLLQPVPGLFTSRSHFREIAGRFARYLDDYLRNGLLEESPRLCARCRERWSAMPPTRGQIVVHDWHEHQYDPARLDRQRAYDERQRTLGLTGVSDAQSDAVSDGVSDAVSAEFLTGDSRAGARRGTRGRAPNVERRTTREKVPGVEQVGEPDDGRPVRVPTLTRAQLEQWSAFGPEWDGFKIAWLDRGLLHPPLGEPDDRTAQRGVLYPILDARPADLARWVREAKGKTAHQVIGEVLERWHAIQADAGVEDEHGSAGDLPKVASTQRLSEILAGIGE